VLPDCTVVNVHGLIGVKHLLAGAYLVVITGKQHVGYILGRSIWRCTGVDIIPYNPALSDRLAPEHVCLVWPLPLHMYLRQPVQ
jgi:hypothetical protein